VPATDAAAVTYGSQTAVAVTSSLSTRFFRLSLVPPAADGMALIPAGSFTIGDTVDANTRANADPTNVYVSAFHMDTNLVSYSQWQTVNNWALTNGYGFDRAGLGKATNDPVYAVSWYDAVKWCNARSEMAGLTPAYYTDGTQTTVYRTGDLDLPPDSVNWAASGYRLPTEAEWEKAARGGLSGQRFPWGDTISESQANYYGCTDCGFGYDLGPNGLNTNFNIGETPYTSPVGYFQANGYGLYDMAGNIFEWCWDWYAASPYPTGSPYLGGADPHGADPLSTFHVVRGGLWYTFADSSRCAYRNYYVPTFAGYDIGFRCVRGF
jgi:formylglycine-generating enzyme required for sulfatase activity